ncbi:DUF4442 domain-containing protein [Salinivibrio proteolyticus]|uniref:PaaI family thioesterase n=1 Tax=Salinivibrio proteolyticus TaxID=334715 RepID=UPI0009894BAF|nr:DUF4442 domain-containing protein [Salinivibrio proteolyticus]OOF25596.1 DUF4442 domain-containing protein [Salinivibrio proteolyticus]
MFSSPLARANQHLSLFGFLKVPMIGWCRPKILAIDDQHVQMRIPLGRRTKNHLNSMYFGALAVGADVAGGFLAMAMAEQHGIKISLAFKAVTADFHKRPEDDVIFTCLDGQKIQAMISETIETGERVNQPVTIVATCPTLHGDEPMATFELTLSLKQIS